MIHHVNSAEDEVFSGSNDDFVRFVNRAQSMANTPELIDFQRADNPIARAIGFRAIIDVNGTEIETRSEIFEIPLRSLRDGVVRNNTKIFFKSNTREIFASYVCLGLCLKPFDFEECKCVECRK